VEANQLLDRLKAFKGHAVVTAMVILPGGEMVQVPLPDAEPAMDSATRLALRKEKDAQDARNFDDFLQRLAAEHQIREGEADAPYHAHPLHPPRAPGVSVRVVTRSNAAVEKEEVATLSYDWIVLDPDDVARLLEAARAGRAVEVPSEVAARMAAHIIPGTFENKQNVTRCEAVEMKMRPLPGADRTFLLKGSFKVSNPPLDQVNRRVPFHATFTGYMKCDDAMAHITDLKIATTEAGCDYYTSPMSYQAAAYLVPDETAAR
jgi:hypothetical protein